MFAYHFVLDALPDTTIHSFFFSGSGDDNSNHLVLKMPHAEIQPHIVPGLIWMHGALNIWLILCQLHWSYSR